MTEKEAKKSLYVFLKRHNIAHKYYYNCIMYNERRNLKIAEYFRLSKKERLKRVINEHCDWFFIFNYKDMDGFFNYNTHAFRWRDTTEGYDYWEKWYRTWVNEMGVRLFEKLKKDND